MPSYLWVMLERHLTREDGAKGNARCPQPLRRRSRRLRPEPRCCVCSEAHFFSSSPKNSSSARSLLLTRIREWDCGLLESTVQSRKNESGRHGRRKYRRAPRCGHGTAGGSWMLRVHECCLMLQGRIAASVPLSFNTVARGRI